MSTSPIETSVQVLGSESDNVPAPIEKQIDIQSLLSKLSSLLPGDRQLERRARKLAWHFSKGRRVRCDWNNVSLSELTPADHRMPDDDFLTLYDYEVKDTRQERRKTKKISDRHSPEEATR